jgi:hypothetical protein
VPFQRQVFGYPGFTWERLHKCFILSLYESKGDWFFINSNYEHMNLHIIEGFEPLPDLSILKFKASHHQPVQPSLAVAF